MFTYLLAFCSAALVTAVVKKLWNNELPVNTPSTTDYTQLMKSMLAYKIRSILSLSADKEAVQEQMMSLVAKLGHESHVKGYHGISQFKLPNLTSVYVLSNPNLIEQFYKNERRNEFSQVPLFSRLAVILGKTNLMSSLLGSATHKTLRTAILNRNEEARSKISQVVHQLFTEKADNPSDKKQTLSELMDALSRRVLLFTYFSEASITRFEELYSPQLTHELMACLFDLEPIREQEQIQLNLLRNKIFALGYQLIFTDNLTAELLASSGWINVLMSKRILSREDLGQTLSDFGINPSQETFTSEQLSQLIHYAHENDDDQPLAKIVRDVVNESLFIPLLGFDATATLLVTSLRIALQDRRIYKIVKHEILEKIAQEKTAPEDEKPKPLELKEEGEHPSYLEALLREALRIEPPAPVIPEVIDIPVTLVHEGKSIVIPAGSLVLIPMQAVHGDRDNFPILRLSPEGQQVFGKEEITPDDIFPERWSPVDPQGKLYLWSPETGCDKDNLLSFKNKSKRACPGARLAKTEAKLMFRMFPEFKFKLENEKDLDSIDYHYNKPLQRDGGQGNLTISRRKEQGAQAPQSGQLSRDRFYSSFPKSVQSSPNVEKHLGTKKTV